MVLDFQASQLFILFWMLSYNNFILRQNLFLTKLLSQEYQDATQNSTCILQQHRENLKRPPLIANLLLLPQLKREMAKLVWKNLG